MKEYVENYWKYGEKLCKKPPPILLLGKLALCLPVIQFPDLNLHLDVNLHPCFLDQKTNVIITILFLII